MPTLEWIGKDKVINHHQQVPFRVLERQYSYDQNGQHDEDNGSENMIIHGDNLEALKALVPRYEGKVKCIYIDPPYNTGNEGWCYNDNVNDPKIQKWLGAVVGKEGEDLSRHDKWLCMMYPRLKLLYKLLADNGIIFISINDIEQAPLKLICNEIFGANNILAQFTWKTDGNFDNQAKVKICHEYILSYMKNPSLLGLPNGVDPTISEESKIFKSEIRNTLVKNGPKNPMSKITLPVGFPCAVENLEIEKRTNTFPYYHQKAIIHNYALVNSVEIESGWSSKDIFLYFIQNNCQYVEDSKKQKTRFEITSTGAIEMIKVREKQSHVISTLSGLGSTQSMSNELRRINIEFDFPKPTKLLEYLIDLYCEDDSIILDSFAGSGVTAHAVLNLNNNGGNRKFILVELMDYADSITAARVKNVINGYKTANEIKKEIFSKKITIGNLKKGNELYEEALEIIDKKAEEFDKISKPTIIDNCVKVFGTYLDESFIQGTGGNFSFYRLGETLLLPDGNLNETIDENKIREYVYYMENKETLPLNENTDKKYYLGRNNDIVYYFYYEKSDITTLDYEFLASIREKADGYIIYADLCTLSESELKRYNITFKKIPRDIAKL